MTAWPWVGICLCQPNVASTLWGLMHGDISRKNVSHFTCLFAPGQLATKIHQTTTLGINRLICFNKGANLVAHGRVITELFEVRLRKSAPNKQSIYRWQFRVIYRAKGHNFSA